MIVGASLSVFLGGGAVTEKNHFISIFAAGGLRIAGLVSLILFITSFVRRAFETQDIDFLLSRPLGRTVFIVSHACSFMILALIFAVSISALVFVLSPSAHSAGMALWAVSLMGEYMILACAALFFAMVISSATSCVLACFGFYILGRMMGQILGIIDAGISSLGALDYIMQVISMVMPRLDLMGQTSWLVYGPDPSYGYGFIALQTALYVAVLNVASVIDLHKRQF